MMLPLPSPKVLFTTDVWARGLAVQQVRDDAVDWPPSGSLHGAAMLAREEKTKMQCLCQLCLIVAQRWQPEQVVSI